MVRITLCMGSSCFARGNGRNLEAVRAYLASLGLEAEVELTGLLCENACNRGPNVAIDGNMHHAVDPATLVALLAARFPGTEDR